MNIHAELDRCVMCGLCSQHCPTYALTQDENETPRGRIAIISALISGQITADASVQEHLNHCTGCRACEPACPSGVRFGSIINHAKTLFPTKRKLIEPNKIDRLRPWLRRYQQWGVQKLVRQSGVLNILGLNQRESLLPKIAKNIPLKPYYPSSTDFHRGDVGLFTGCISRVFDLEALTASRFLLNQLGYGVHIPPTQVCCGAMHLHAGQTHEAISLAQQNLAAFNKLDIEAIVHTTSGCTAILSEYATLSDEFSHDAVEQFTHKIQDISQFLSEAEGLVQLQPKPFPKTVVLHSPCSLKNVLRQAEAPRHLLQAIPDITVLELPQNDACCGGAGDYMLTQPEFSQRLRENSLNRLHSLHKNITLLVTSNLGCAINLSAGLQQADIEVLHPVVLLARLLGFKHAD